MKNSELNVANNRLDTFERHQLKIAKDSMKLSCIGCWIMGGPNHVEAANIIKKLTGKVIKGTCECEDSMHQYNN